MANAGRCIANQRHRPVRDTDVPIRADELLRLTVAIAEPPPTLRPLPRTRVDRLSGGQFQLLTVWACLGGDALVAVLTAAGSWLSRRLLLEHFFPENMAANGQSPWRLHLGFDLLVALSVALATQSIGVMATFCLVFFPPWVAFRIAGSWKRALLHCAGISVTAYLAAFVVAILLDQPFGPVLVGTLVVLGLVRLPFRARR